MLKEAVNVMAKATPIRARIPTRGFILGCDDCDSDDDVPIDEFEIAVKTQMCVCDTELVLANAAHPWDLLPYD